MKYHTIACVAGARKGKGYRKADAERGRRGDGERRQGALRCESPYSPPLSSACHTGYRVVYGESRLGFHENALSNF